MGITVETANGEYSKSYTNEEVADGKPERDWEEFQKSRQVHPLLSLLVLLVAAIVVIAVLAWHLTVR